ncbi:MAG TPA: DUF2341 domain-containing protein [Bacteroidales bacterium]|nr:DUF2341 domain-containing protein [Bacteroidales bacterium]
MSTMLKAVLKVMIVIIMKGLLPSQVLVGQSVPVFPDDWLYQKAVTITGTGADLTDFQVKISLNVENFEFPKAQNNGGDIRFLDSDRATQLSYWIESWVFPTSATIWVKVPSLPAGGKTIYLCYGIPMSFDTSNPDIVESTSSGENTFLFFDDFSGTTLDQTKWTPIGSPGFTIIDGVVRLTGEGSNDKYLLSTGSYSDFVMDLGLTMTSDANSDCIPAIGFRVESDLNRYIATLHGESVNELLLSRYQEGAAPNPVEYNVPYNYTANHPYNCRIVASGTNIEVFLDGLSVVVLDDGGSSIVQGGVSLANLGGLVSGHVDFDIIRIRAYSPAEPVAGIYSEEKEWTGSTEPNGTINRNWNVAKNWSPAGVPTFMDNATVPFIDNNRQPYLTGSEFRVYEYTECNDLTIGPGTELLLRQTGDLTINGDLTNNGTIVSVSYKPEDGGSLIVRGATSGTGIVTFRRYLRTESNFGDRHYISSPVGGQTLSVFTQVNGVRIASDANGYRIWRYQETNDSWPRASGVFENGHGYNIDQATGSDGLMIFSGSIVTATEAMPVSVKATSPYRLSYDERYALDPSNPDPYGVINHDADIWANDRSWTAYGGGGWNLLGNPFTSAMDAAAFISYNDGKFDPDYQALYLYDGVNDVYKYAASIVPGWDEPIEEEGGYWNINKVGNFSDFIHTGQGFFVLAQYDNIDFYFTSSMQQHAHPYLFLLKSAPVKESWPGLRLKAKYGEKEKSTLLVYNDSMTLGLDKGYDVGLLSADSDLEIYTSLLSKDNGVNFTRQAIPLIDFEQHVIPVGVDTEKGGGVTFYANTVNIENYRFWLEDRLTGIFTDLSIDSYTVTLPPKTYGTGRFFIVASATAPTVVEDSHMDDIGLRIWSTADKIVIKGKVSDMAICSVFNLQGQKILEVHLKDSDLNTISLDHVLSGVYLIRVFDGAKVITKKTAILK